MCMVFFFKQKTSCEMRISDWSSDVCSSDLVVERLEPGEIAEWITAAIDLHAQLALAMLRQCLEARHQAEIIENPQRRRMHGIATKIAQEVAVLFEHQGLDAGACEQQAQNHPRSEEHTSELQSLMRNSYAVLCLKKTKQIN